jgi:hypothetical protein
MALIPGSDEVSIAQYRFYDRTAESYIGPAAATPEELTSEAADYLADYPGAFLELRRLTEASGWRPVRLELGSRTWPYRGSL